MAIPAVILTTVKSVALNLFMKKVTKEIDRGFEKIEGKINTDGDVVVITDTIQAAVLSPRKVSAWVSVVTALVYFASSQGYIAPEIAELINSILSNPETVTAIEEMVE